MVRGSGGSVSTMCAWDTAWIFPPHKKESLVPDVGSGGGSFSEFSLGGHGTPGSLTSDELRYVRVGSWQRHVGFRKGGPLK